MKVKDIILEDTRVRDPYAYDYERDPETGEYTYRTTPDRGPGMFTRMLQKHTGDLPSFVPTDEPPSKTSRQSRIKVPAGKRLVTSTNDGRIYYKLPAGAADSDKSGRWVDQNNRSIASSTSVEALERLARKNGRLEDLPSPAAPAAEPQAADQTSASGIEAPDTYRTKAEPEPEAPITIEPEEPINLADQPLANDERISVDTPAGPFYKYPDGNWYQIPTTGTPVRASSSDYGVLDDYANREGAVEKIPATPKRKGRK